MFKILSVDYYKRKNIKEIYNIQDEIDFNPDYQRKGDVWKQKQKQLLIDSIINGFDIPKFYFHILNDNDINKSKKRYAIIDGKQRLSSIIEFINGEYKLANDFIYFDDASIELRSLTFNDMKLKYPDIAFKVYEYQLDIIYVVTDSKQLIECFFSRLNSGQPLVNSEKRNAKSGYIKSWIENTVNTYDFFTKKIRFSNSRSVYNDILAKFILIELNNEFTNMGKGQLDELYDNHKDNNKNIDRAIYDVIIILDIMIDIFEDKDKLLGVRSSLPVYYKFIKDVNANDRNLIRGFLIEFDTNRKEKGIKDSKIIKYNLYQSKSTEQKVSMQYRYDILIDEFYKYCENIL